MSDNNAVSGGITLGGLLATILSWTTNHSILFCVLHFLCGWIYVIYWFFTYSGKF